MMMMTMTSCCSPGVILQHPLEKRDFILPKKTIINTHILALTIAGCEKKGTRRPELATYCNKHIAKHKKIQTHDAMCIGRSQSSWEQKFLELLFL